MARMQFQGVFEVVFAGQKTVDIANAAVGSGTFGSATVSIPGAKVGDHVLVDALTAAETDGAPVVGKVSATDTVRLTTLNNSAGAVDYASQVYNITVLRLLLK